MLTQVKGKQSLTGWFTQTRRAVTQAETPFKKALSEVK